MTTAQAAREQARRTDGRFGTQARGEVFDVDLSPDQVASEAPQPDGRPVYTMSVEAFTERFEPGEYDFNGGWEGTADHEAFLEPNPFNPERIHAGTWDAFVADIGANGIREPVEVDPYDEALCEGHHRVVAAMATGQPIRFRIADGPNDEHVALAGEMLAAAASVDEPNEPAPTGTVDPGPPSGRAWERRVSEYTGLVTYGRVFPVIDGTATHDVSGTVPGQEPQRDGEAIVLGSGGITISQDAKIPGQCHYKILDAPLLDEHGNDTGERAKAIYINWVEVQRNKGKGWATKMYASIRDAHPDCIIPAAANLEAPGKRLVRHYRDKHPDQHTGRFDTDGRIHPTTGSGDKAYRSAMLLGPSGEN